MIKESKEIIPSEHDEIIPEPIPLKVVELEPVF